MVAAALLSISAPPKARAANVFWDFNGTSVGTGGSGAWDTTNAYWFNAGSDKSITGTGTTAAYTFTNADTAYITMANGQLSLGTGFGVTLGGLVFGREGSTVSGGTITLNAGVDGSSNPISPVIAAHTGGVGAWTGGSTFINSVLAGTNGFTKEGGGNLVLTGANPSLSGAVIVNAGILELGVDLTSLGSTSLKLNAGSTLSLIAAGNFTIANNITIAGPATINSGALTVNSNGFSRGTSGSVTLANTTLNFNNTNRHSIGNTTGDDVGISGTLTLQGLGSVIYLSQVNANTDFSFSGKITGSGALTLIGNGGGSFSNATNDYSGGTNFFGGWRGPNNTTASMGTGAVFAGPGQLVYLRAPANIASASSVAWTSSLSNFNVNNYFQMPTGAVGTVGMSGLSSIFAPNDLAIGSSYNAIKSGPYGSSLALMSNWTNALDMALIGSHTAGNAPWWLAAQASFTYSASSLGADGGVYRLGAAGSTTLTFSTAALAGDNSVIVGIPFQRASGIGNAGGSIVFNAQQTYTGSTTINRGNKLILTSTTLSNLIPSASALYVAGALDLSGAFSVAGPMLGQSAVTAFNTAYTNTGNGQTAGIQFNNNAVTTASTDIRIANSATLNLTSANFRFLGATAAVATNQTIGTINFEGQDLLEISRGNAAANNANFTVTNLNRLNNGVFLITTTGGAFSAAAGTDTKFTVTNIRTAGTGTGVALTNGMVAPWILDSTAVSFLTSGATGLGPVTYNVTASTPALLQGANATQIVDMTANNLMTANATMQALRISTGVTTGNFNITIGSGAAVTDGAGLIIGNNGNFGQANNWIFGNPLYSLGNLTTISGSSTVSVRSTSGLVAGMAFTGPNIPAGTTISSVTNSTTLVLSAAATGTYTSGLSTTAGSTTVTVTSTTGLSSGMAFSGLNIPAGTTISSVTNGTTLVLSQAAVATGVQPGFHASATVGQREAVIYVNGFVQTLSGMVSATGLTKAGGGELILIGNNTGYMTTASSTAVAVSNSALYTVGQPFTGPGIPAGATVASIVDGKSITISAAATNSVTTQIGALAQLSGTITINAGKLTVTSPTYLGVRTNPNNPYTIDTPDIRLAGGSLNTTGVNSNNANYLSNITVTSDSTIDNGPSAGAARWGSLTFAARQGSNPEPIMLTFNNVGEIFTGGTILNQNTWINHTTGSSGVNAVMLQGPVSGAGTLDKFGVGTLALLSGSSTMSGAITVHQGNLISLARNSTDTPFGTSTITVNQGGAIILTTPNVGGGLTLNSDLVGLATIGLNYIGAVPTFTANNANTGGPFSAVIAIDVVGYDQPIDQSTLGGGKTFLGAAWGQNEGSGVARNNSANFIGTLTPGTTTAAASGFATAPSGSTYRFGGGGIGNTSNSSGGWLNLNRTNLLTGANNVVFGAINNAIQANSVGLLGGVGGVTVMNTANNYSGYTTFNQDQTVQIGNSNAFGTSTLIFNGGRITSDAYGRYYGFSAGRQIANNIQFSGDIILNSNFNTVPSDLTFTGTVGLSNDAVGGSLRTITVNTATYAQAAGSIATFSGVISDGASAYNSLNKAGAGTLRLTNTNTYTGITLIQAGNIAITSTGNLGTNPLVNLGGGALSIWEQDVTLTKTLNFIANSSVDVSEGRTLTQATLGWTSTSNGIFTKTGSGTLVLTVPNNFWQLVVGAGTVSVSDRSQLGLTSVGFNNAAPFYGTGGIPVLRFTANPPNIDANFLATTAGAVSVDAGMTATLISTGSTGTLYKVGTGTVSLAANVTTAPTWDIRQGTLLVGNYTSASTPLGANPSPTIAGGTLQINATTADLAVTIGTGSINFSGGGTLALTSTSTYNSQLTVQNLTRSGFGTLIIAPTSNLGGATPSTQRSRIVVNGGGWVMGTPVGTAQVNGILPPVREHQHAVRLRDAFR